MNASLTDATLYSWGGLLLLGAFHGVNPGMGWLFAVALGMQEQRRRAVWRSLLPLAAGHILAVAAALIIASLFGRMLSAEKLRWPVAAVLISLGVYRLYRPCRPLARTGMQVGLGGLTLWSFLMATAHGAGLMVLPIFLGPSFAGAHASTVHAAEPVCGPVAAIAGAAPAAAAPLAGLLASAIHGFGYLAVTALIAVLVFEKFGLGLLRKAWFNLDLVWAVALIATGALAILI